MHHIEPWVAAGMLTHQHWTMMLILCGTFLGHKRFEWWGCHNLSVHYQRLTKPTCLHAIICLATTLLSIDSWEFGSHSPAAANYQVTRVQQCNITQQRSYQSQFVQTVADFSKFGCATYRIRSDCMHWCPVVIWLQRCLSLTLLLLSIPALRQLYLL